MNILNIPKLAKGGIIQDNMLFSVSERKKPIVDIINKKYFNIYNKTKNRRIKKKQIKKCPILQLKLELEEYVCLGNCYNKDIKICINDRQIKKVLK